MEDLYRTLQCDSQSSEEELRQSYMKLARQYHPDKQQTSDSTAFVKLQRAWEVLGDPSLRKEYDIRWRDRCLIQDLPIQEDVQFSDFDLDQEDRLFTYPCRCGGEYAVTEVDARLHYDIVCCETCSLTIRVLYSDEAAENDSHVGNSENASQDSNRTDNVPS